MLKYYRGPLVELIALVKLSRDSEECEDVVIGRDVAILLKVVASSLDLLADSKVGSCGIR